MADGGQLTIPPPIEAETDGLLGGGGSSGRPLSPGKDIKIGVEGGAAAKGGGSAADEASRRKLGTLTGVFLPCLQNILGVILFLRLPYIVGQAGTLRASAIVILCCTCTLLTALSMSAIATNGRVARGGPYFLLSRNLGAQWGGSIGILFYLGASCATSLYVLGAVEALQSGFSFRLGLPFEPQILSLLLMWLLTLIVSVGVRHVNMASGVFLSVVLLSVLSILIGIVFFVTGSWDGAVAGTNEALKHGDLTRNLGAGYTGSWDFGSLLALFFPSVTGIMAGANRSDVLRNPERSIPVGTLRYLRVLTSDASDFFYLLTTHSLLVSPSPHFSTCGPFPSSARSAPSASPRSSTCSLSGSSARSSTATRCATTSSSSRRRWRGRTEASSTSASS